MTTLNLGERFVAWAKQESSIRAIIQIGSRVRVTGGPGAADPDSDWDYQVISSAPELLYDRTLPERSGMGRPIAWVTREGRLGSARKITALFADGELDVVILPAKRLRLARWLVNLGIAWRLAAVKRGLADLGIVLRDGYRFSKGEAEWGAFFLRVATEVPIARLSDRDVCALAEGFMCDYISTRRKIKRGELLAAQRWLHHQLAETNFRLLHELRLRAGAPSFPDARRVEKIVGDPWRATVAVDARLDENSLRAATLASARACRELTRALVGNDWHWPDMPAE